ncbi:MAG TPA: prepilin-type N-terminal cleavage/methylation domain-containing protein [Gemmatimonadales bacterium]|jgi:type IV pilus assembly protein PilA
MKRKGFTLIELIIVMAIIGLLAAIAIPQLTYTKERAQVAAMKSDLRNLMTVEENYFADSQKYSTNLGTAYRVSAGNDMPTITTTPDGWSASMTSPNSTEICAVFVGSTPLPPATKEGSAACAKRDSTTRITP